MGTADFVRAYYRQRISGSKTRLFTFNGKLLSMGNCDIALIYEDLIFINETVTLPEITGLKNIMEDMSKEFQYTLIYIPFQYGEEDMPSIEEIKSRLENRLKYWLYNKHELTNNKIRGQYKTFYEQFMKFLSTTSHEEINADLNALYKHIKNRKYLKQLKLEVARRRNIK